MRILTAVLITLAATIGFAMNFNLRDLRLLFATGLYAIYQQRGEAFVTDYKNLLASTGEASAADLAARFGIDLRSKAFWQGSLKIMEARIERYCQI